jgi:transmembrane sensor
MTADPINRNREASRWLDRLERGLRDQEGEALRVWLTVAENRSCLLSQARLGRGADVMAVLTRLFPDSPELKTTRGRRHKLSMAAVCAGAAGVVVAAYFAFNGRPPWSFDFRAASAERFARRIYATAPDQTRRIALPDGSVMTLNGATQVEIFYWPRSRMVGLPQGEASFHVLPAPDRPFTVSVGARVFEVEGEKTSTFDIRILAPDSLELAVTDGKVKALYIPSGYLETSAEARLRANSAPTADTVVGPLELISVEPGSQVVRKLAAAELQQRVAWQAGSVRSAR